MTTKSVSLEQRVLHAVHHHFRLYGCSPSYIDIALAVGIDARHVGRPLDGLTRRGLLTRTPGEARSIVLTERMANFSDAEIERAILARGGRIAWSQVPELAEIFLAPVATCGMETDHELDHLLGMLTGEDHGGA